MLCVIKEREVIKMSIRVNNYEKNIINKLQMTMTKKEAEEVIYEIREELYDDIYHMISPIHYIDENGKLHNDFPNPNALIEAYWTGDYSQFRK